MNREEAKLRIENLSSEINRHNHLYYVKNSPEISDKEFDMLLKELESLEREYPEFKDPNSPTQRVGSDLAQNGFEHIRHSRPMMSLGNTYNIEEVAEWIKRVNNQLPGQKIKISTELKYDGTSISVIYRNGKLYKAVTRGDGIQGDDVTENVKTIMTVPLVLQQNEKYPYPEEIEFRGEILMHWKVFDELNAERELSGESLFANPRNAASGTLKMLNSAEVARRKLYAVFYSVLSDDLPSESHYENLEIAREWGINTATPMLLDPNILEIEGYIKNMDKARGELPFPTDGLVFKVNDISQQDILGATAKSPRWAIAYKFNPEQAVSRLDEVTFETGRMGTVTPVANFDPVMLSGSIVKRASLHNEDNINNLDIHEHDYVVIEKAGEIIPQVVNIDIKRREPGALKVLFPEYCPSCGTRLVRVPGEAAWKCPNKDGCEPQILGKFEHFAGRKMMNILDLGEKLIEWIYKSGLIRRTSDLYLLKKEELVKCGLGEKTSENILASLEESKKQPFEKVLYALSILNVGETTAKRLAEHFGSIDAIMSAGVDDLMKVPDIGRIIADSVVDYFSKEENLENIRVLRECGLQMECAKKEVKSDVLAGKSIVISGKFTEHSRDDYKRIIEENGGKNVSSISNKTSFVLAGDDMGPSKKDKCEKLGVPIIGEYEFLEMIGER